MKQEFEIGVVSPTGSTGVEVLRAAARAGGLAIVDAAHLNRTTQSLHELLEVLGPRCGLRLEVSEVCTVAPLLKHRDSGSEETRQFDVILLTGHCDAERLSTAIATLRPLARRIFREVVSVSEAEQALASGVDDLVAKGNESGGRVGTESIFVLLQRLRAHTSLPIWAQGGIGPNTAAACRVAGAQGILLDNQLALAEEADLPPTLRAQIAAMDGTETICLGESLNVPFRVHRLRGKEHVKELQALEASGASADEFQITLARVLATTSEEPLCPLGQDAALASRLAARYRTTAEILRAYRQHVVNNITLATEQLPLRENSESAQSHGLRFPIFQGPMTRVSDVAPFADAVARGGGLPFLALALLREAAVERLLQETNELLGERSWGVGILGFVPAELRNEQMRAVLKTKPRYALLAGGRPDQAQALEAEGIATYIHAPSPRLLEMFLRQGSRRFIFEGRECGGHVGPLSSFMLWESALDVLLDFQEKSKENKNAEPIHVLFAGGIHDNLSAAMVSALAAKAVAAGIRIGVLMGTAYLFTSEAVQSGAIIEGFQQEAIACRDTVLLDTQGGHAIRCAPTSYAAEFAATKRRLLQAGSTPEEARRELEALNLGRLRIASKGVSRGESLLQADTSQTAAASTRGDTYADVVTDAPADNALNQVPVERQKREGMYMIGEVAALRDQVITVEELHQQVSHGASEQLQAFAAQEKNDATAALQIKDLNQPIAIIGMGCLYPGASNPHEFWTNILKKHDAITEVPRARWFSEVFYDTDPNVPDRVVSKWGGFLNPIHFDPLAYGIPPNTLSSVEPMQLLMLEVVRQTLADAGYDKRPFARERTGVVIGAGGGMADLGLAYGTRCMVEQYLHQVPGLEPEVRQRVLDGLHETLPVMTEDSFPGILANVTAGRVASRFDLGGPNFTVDAACASSLAALEAGVKELRHGSSDLILVGGVDTQQSPFSFLVFSKTHALSPTGRCRPFDAKSDGIAIGEGVASVLLKRLNDAVRDGDRIYAVLRGIAGGSDGRDKSLTAPSVKGQRRAMQRAYEGLEFTPSAIGLVEAHGTGTVVGDRTELQSMHGVFTDVGAAPQSCALGSVKSMIGHTKNAAGIAGLIKATLALHHRTLPPTLANEPNEAARDRSTPFYLNTQARPWFSNGSLRRAAVSAFGFGGTNFHAVLEEFESSAAANTQRPAELFLFRAASRAELAKRLQALDGALAQSIADKKQIRLIDLSATVCREALKLHGECRLAIVAENIEELRTHLTWSVQALQGDAAFPDHRVVSYNDAAVEGKVAFLFPGQGSQTVNMLAELALHFPVVQEAFESADRVLDGVLPEPLTSALFPPPAYFPAEEQEQRAQLNRTEWTQPALGAANCAMLALLRHLGIQPDMLGGHSYGEYVALHAAGVLSFADLMQLSAARGRIVQETQGNSTVGMLAVRESAAHVTEIIAANSDVSIAAQNAPQQTVIGGAVEAIEAIVPHFDAAKISYQRLAVSAGFHVPEARSAAEPLQRVLDGIAFNAPAVPVYSNRTADEYPREASEAKRLLLQHLSETVRFKEQVEQMHEDGARIFIEVGPKAVLSSLVRQTLENQAVIVLPTNSQPASTSMADLLRAVGHLFVSGVALQPERLFSGCKLQPLKIEELAQPTAAPSPATWIVDGGKARPLRENGARNGAAPTGKKRDLPKAAQHAQGTSTQHAMSRGPSENFRDQKTQALPKENMTTTPHKGTHPAQPSQPSSVGTSGSRTVTPQTAASQPPTTPPAMPAQSAGVVVDNASAAGVMSAFQASMQSFLEHQSQAQAQRQQLMAQFLQTQQAVVEAYLASASGQPLPQHTAAPQIPTLIQSVAAPQQQTYTASQPISQVVAPPVAPAPVEVPVAPNHVAVAQNGTNGYHPPHVEQNGSAAITLTHAAPAPELTQVNTVEPVLHTNNDVAEPVVAAPAETADLQSVVLEMVSEYTGYPIEMLELDQNMEADLGIDSIKRTEIFGGLRDRLGMGGEKFDQEEYFIKIARLRTLQEVIDWLQEEVDDAAVQSSGETPLLPETGTQTALQKVGAQSISDNATTQPNAETAIKDLRRYVIRAEVQPLDEAQRQWDEQQIILVTEDGAGRARELVTALHSGGVNVALVRHAATTRNMGSGVYEADLLSRDSVQQLKALVEEHHGKITALCHLLSLEPHQDTEDGLAVKSLFHLAQAFEAELRAANGTIVAVTGLGGTFGLQGENKVHVGQAAVTGFLKSLAQEWPEVFIKALDVDAAASEEFLLPQLMAEIGTAGRTVEVGYSETGRMVLRAVQEELNQAADNELFCSDSVLLVTGGARGITAAVCEELATRYKPTLVVVGRSPFPADETPQTAILTTASDLKRVLAERRKERGEEVTPLAVEAAYQAILRGREIRANLQRLQSLGARPEYYSLDVRDAAAFEALIEATYEKHGRIDGVIHGAGVIEDNLLANKTAESFNRVFDTKVVAAQTLARTLRPESLQLVVFFSSIAARLGNAGQTDYAAANEALNKLAAELDRKWPARVVSIGWGPWEGAGMASPLLREHLAKSGLDYLPLDAGRQLFLQEIESGRKGEAEVLLLAAAGDGPQQGAEKSETHAIVHDTVLPDEQALLSSFPLSERERV